MMLATYLEDTYQRIRAEKTSAADVAAVDRRYAMLLVSLLEQGVEELERA